MDIEKLLKPPSMKPEDVIARLREDHAICEKENDNLRTLLRWAAERLPAGDLDKLEGLMKPCIEDGGIVEDGGFSELQIALKDLRLFDEVAEHLELLDKSPLPKGWRDKALRLAGKCREAGPKNPVVARVMGQPNVLHITRSKIAR